MVYIPPELQIPVITAVLNFYQSSDTERGGAGNPAMLIAPTEE